MVKSTTATTTTTTTTTIVITDAQIVAVLGVRERFTRPISEAIERACDALHRLADDLGLKRRRSEEVVGIVEHAAPPPPLLATQKDLVVTAAASIGEAVRLEAAYQGALLLATDHGLSGAAASMPALSTYLLGAFLVARGAGAAQVQDALLPPPRPGQLCLLRHIRLHTGTAGPPNQL